MGVAQKTTFSNPEILKKIFGVSGDVMEYNERGKSLKRNSSLTNPKSAGLHMPFSKKNTPLHLPIQNILLAVNPFHCFFAKSLWAGKIFPGPLAFCKKAVEKPLHPLTHSTPLSYSKYSSRC